MVPLGKSPVEVNGKVTTAIVALAHGDRRAPCAGTVTPVPIRCERRVMSGARFPANPVR